MNTQDARKQSIFAEIHANLSERLPESVMTGDLVKNLQKRIQFFMDELTRRSPGQVNEQEVKRLTYDSITTWIRRNAQSVASDLRPVPSGAAPPTKKQQQAAAPPPPPSFTPTYIPRPDFNAPVSHEAEDDLLAQLGFAPSRPLPGSLNQERLPPPEATSLPPMQKPIAELQPISTRKPLFESDSPALQPKDYIIANQDVVKYIDTEHNLIINSFDRDWVRNTKENRYQFTVNFNGGFITQGAGPQTNVRDRIRNIVRIEFVKVLLPVEGLEMVTQRDCSGATSNGTVVDACTSVLALPFVQVILDEMNGNNIGTSETVDRALAICQYDSTWRSDQINGNRGYTLFFPKLMKAQRLYQPTPLSNLQTLSFSILNPEGGLLSTVPDKMALSRVVFSDVSDASGSCYHADANDTSGSEYVFLQTTKWFPHWAFVPLDRIQVGAFTVETPLSPGAASALEQWLNDPAGHIVVGLVHWAATGAVSGANLAGYANGIVIRNRLTDPADTGTPLPYMFTGGNSSAETIFANSVAAFPSSYQRGAILNRSRQVQMTLRVVTRDLDMASTVRADNV